ncbi:energy transducer TonB [Tritonibacter mobilis]|uniref:energy transducer TonB n=1 Tax=Tritonibacter mobilis TaxID=379347 RepID=UPI000E0CD4B6|nr:energy transducer TonB [Tritonibacter mobilis]
MQTGTKISVAGHGLLITWALVGGWLNPEPLPFQSQDVSIISAEEFARLSEQQVAPEVAEEPVAPQEPAVTESTPAIPERPTPTPEPPVQPEPIETPAEDAEAEPPAPEPEPEVPSIIPDAPDVPEIVTDLPQTAEPETAQQTDRVAPEPVRPPEPDTQISDVVQEEVAPDAGAEANQPVQEATAPEAASDRIVTEAEADDAEPTAPLASVRPRTRPNRPQPEPEPEPEAETQTAAREEETTPSPEPNPEVESSAVDDALAEALAGSGEVEAPEPSGPPMTRGEKDALRVAVSQCWNVGSLSSEALRTSVVVGVTLSREGMPDIGSIRMLSSSGGSDSSAKQAYEAARRAIIRCGSRGFDLPADKYAQWRDIEMTFNPEGMRIR